MLGQRRLDVAGVETQTLCYAWAFLPNHAHFLLRRVLWVSKAFYGIRGLFQPSP